MKRLMLLAMLASACAPPIVVRDQEAACRVARDMMHEQMSAADLVELTAPFPRAYPYAVRAYRARLAALVMTGLGAAALAGSFITGFAADTSEASVRAGLGTVIGVTLGLGVGAMITGPLSLKWHNAALNTLADETHQICP